MTVIGSTQKAATTSYKRGQDADEANTLWDMWELRGPHMDMSDTLNSQHMDPQGQRHAGRRRHRLRGVQSSEFIRARVQANRLEEPDAQIDGWEA